MLKNACLLVKIGADTAENELNFAEILPIGHIYGGPDVADRQNSNSFGAAASGPLK